MSDNGRTIINIKTKTNIFLNHYVRVSNLNMSQADRDLNTTTSIHNSTHHLLTMKVVFHLKWVSCYLPLKRWRVRGTAGPDDISPFLLKSFGPLTFQELLSIFNSSFSLAHCPQIWRVAVITTLMNAGKSSSEVASFCTISTISCVVKLLEKILADRLYFIAVTKNLFNRFQAGFRKGRNCEDQYSRIVQAIEEDFQ